MIEDEELAESWDDAANGNEDDPDEDKDEDVGLVRDDAVGEAEVAGDQAEKEA